MTIDYPSHWQARMATIAMHVNTTGQGKTMLLGDSQTDAFWWNVVGNDWIVNAGFGGARVRSFIDFIDLNALVQCVQPSTTHVQIGTNNLFVDPAHAEWTTLAADIHSIVNTIKSVGSKVVLWFVPPMSQASAPTHYAANLLALNNTLGAEANANGAFADWWFPQQITGAGGYAAAGALLNDGTHYSPATQAARYYRIVAWSQYLQTL